MPRPSEKKKPLLELEEEVLQEWLLELVEERYLTTRREDKAENFLKNVHFLSQKAEKKKNEEGVPLHGK